MNELKLLGNLGGDPEVKTLSGVLVATMSLAIPGKVTDWFNFTALGKQAEYARDYLRKGDTVLLEGHIKPTRWTDKDTGKTMQSIQITADKIQGIRLTRSKTDEVQATV